MKHNTIETIATGNMQFNAKTGKNFRSIMAKWHNADFELAEEILRKQDRVSALKRLIKSNLEIITKLENGETVIGNKTVSDYTSENAEFAQKIEKENTELAEYKKAQEERYASARDLLSKDLHKAYVEFITLGKRDEYMVALANFFVDNGFEPTVDTLNKFMAAVGKKKNSSRQKVKTGSHNGSVSYQAWRDIFLGEICDLMGDSLPLYKFTYVLKEKRNETKA